MDPDLRSRDTVLPVDVCIVVLAGQGLEVACGMIWNGRHPRGLDELRTTDYG